VNMIRWRRRATSPTAISSSCWETDEELGDRNSVGIRWLIKNHRDLLDAELALNEGGPGVGV